MKSVLVESRKCRNVEIYSEMIAEMRNARGDELLVVLRASQASESGELREEELARSSAGSFPRMFSPQKCTNFSTHSSQFKKAKIIPGLPIFRSILSVHMTKNKRLNITPEWYKSSNNRPKLFNATLERVPDGTYRVIEAAVEAVVNQHESHIQAVDARDFARSLRDSRVFAL